MKKVIYLLLLVWLPVANMAAQTVYKDQVRIEKQSATRSKDNQLIISMDVIMQANMKISSNRAAILTPILDARGNQKLLPAIVVYGRNRALVNERNNSIPKDAYTVVRRKRKTEQRVSYLIQIPYEKWMQSADLVMDADLCGCRNRVEANTLDPITSLRFERAKPQPQIAYIVPQKENIKQRSIEGKAYLDFPVNRTEIHPDYRRNQTELAKIRATIDTVRNDRNTSIDRISIEGYASPEGKYPANARLAQGRAAALVEYVRNYYNFPKELMQVNSTPEDWDGFRQFIAQSNIEKKEEVLQIMDNPKLTDYDLKENNIRNLVGPATYKFILNECYPTLRHSDYAVFYTIRPFNNEEVKELIHTHPQQLSLEEIFNVSLTYEPGSEAFNHAFKVAVLMYPNNATANLNAAAMELQRGGDIAAAKKYLAKADQSEGATLNNLGVIALLENDFNAASDYLARAKAAGCKEADANLEELAKLKEDM